MKELFPQQPFCDRYEFTGALSQGENLVDGLQIVLQFPLVRQGEIVGKILGTKETYEKLDKLADISAVNMKLRSAKHPGIGTEISSDTAHLQSLSWEGWPPPYSDSVSCIVAQLMLEDLTLTDRVDSPDLPARYLVFFLAGPTTAWAIHSRVELSYTGDTKVQVRNSSIELNEALPFRVEVRPWFFHDKAQDHLNSDLTTSVISLQFETDEPVEALSDEDFVGKAKDLTEDLILLMSFVSRSWITWFRYELHTKERLQAYVKQSRECSSGKVEYDDMLVDIRKSRDFLRTAYTSLLKLRGEGFNLFMPLVYYVSGNEAKYVEDQFSTLFLCLEKTKDTFAAKEEGLKEILSDDAFKQLENNVRRAIRESVGPTEARERIYEKLRELNRPSLHYVLDRLLSKYQVTWTDVYPPGKKLTLIETRDKLFHSSQEIDIDELIREKDRLQAIVERILLSMLGWTNLTRSPTEFKKRWLTSVG